MAIATAARLTLSLAAVAVAAGAAQAASSPTTAKADASDHHFLRNQVKIIDQGSDQGGAAYDLRIVRRASRYGVRAECRSAILTYH